MSPPLRAWVGGIVQETTAFSPIPTAFEDFEDFGRGRVRWPGYGEFIEEARAAGMTVHGAQMAEGCDDCEGELIAAVRAQVGPACRIGVLLDLQHDIHGQLCGRHALCRQPLRLHRQNGSCRSVRELATRFSVRLLKVLRDRHACSNSSARRAAATAPR